MTTNASRPQCRAFEEALEHGPPLEESGPPNSPHLLECQACQDLVAQIRELGRLTRCLSKPEPSRSLMENLASIPEEASLPVWKESQEVLRLLTPGSLKAPELSESLRSRLLAIPRPRTEEEETPSNVVPFQARKSRRFEVLRDWRVAVALVYAATIVVAVGLRWDPATVARRAASGLTETGERAVAEAREKAAQKLATSLQWSRSRPLREQLDYRIYRTLAVSRAKATAYTGLVLEKVFGREERQEQAGAVESKSNSSRSSREPEDPEFRS